jgi:hypothetical protein
MKLLAPAWLGLLLLAIPILLLHMQRRRTIVTSSLLLWQGLDSQARQRRSLQKPPLSAALLLQLLALLLASLILARPVEATRPDHLILLLDASGSAQQGAIAASLEEARRQISGLAAHDDALWSLIAVTDQPVWLAARWPAAETTLAEAAARLLPGDAAADWSAAARLAAPLLTEREAARVVLLGGSAAEQQLVQAELPGTSVQAVGDAAASGPAPGFTSLRLEPVAPAVWLASGTVSSGGLTTAEAEVLITMSFAPVPIGAASPEARAAVPEMQQLSVPLLADGNGAWQGEFRWKLELPGPGVLTFSAPEPGEAATPAGASQRASFVLYPEPLQVPVLYLGAGNPALRYALQALPYVTLSEATSLPADSSSYALVIIDGVTVPHAPQASTLWIGTGQPQDSLLDEPNDAPLISGAISGWNTLHPLMAGLQWAGVTIDRALLLPPLPGAAVLLQGSEGPLIRARATGAGHQVQLAFDPAHSNWPGKTSFPLFMRNLIHWLEPDAGRHSGTACEVSRACPLPAGSSGGRLIDPQGRTISLPQPHYGDALGSADHFVPQQAGIYLLQQENGPARPLAVNLFAPVPLQPASPQQAAGSGTPLETGGAGWNLRGWLQLALLLTLVAEGWLAYLRHSRFPQRRNWLLPGLRLGLLFLLVLALADLRLPLPQYSGQTVVLLPADLQITGADPAQPGAQEGDKALAQLLAAAGADGLSLVSTDASPELVAAPGLAPSAAGNREAAVTSGVNPAQGLQLASALLRPGLPGRIVLAGDGAQTRGDYLSVLASLPRQQLDVLLLGSMAAGEVLLQSLSAPAVLAGDRFSLDAFVYSGSEQDAVLRAYRDGRQTGEQLVQLRQGSNRFTLDVQEEAAGSFLHELEITAAGDMVSGNNRNGLYVQVGPAPNVLLVAAQPGWGRMLAGALELQGARVDLVTPEAAPLTLEGLLGYHAIMLANVPALDLGAARQELLETAVQDHGRTLFLLGGENTFGPGGYFETPLERLSPASSLVPREAPAVALAFVLDRSNSMRQYAGDAVRLDIAKVATLRALELLPDTTRAALIVFDSTARTLVPLRETRDDEELATAIRELEPRGGTSLYPALVEAFAQLEGSGAAAAHMIVMSDGLSQPGDFPGILREITDAGITVSTIAIGPEADFEQLQEVAHLGGGAFHASRDFFELPGIMAHEVLLLDGELFEESPVQPVMAAPDAALLRGWPQELPPLHGFVPTTLKPGAEQLLTVTSAADEIMPLLSSWQYGAGRVLAFASHAAGPWSSAWLELAEYPLLWDSLLRQSLLPAQPGLNLQAVRDGDLLQVSVAADAGPAEPEAAAGMPALQLRQPDGSAQQLQLYEVSPGRHAASVLVPAAGNYLLEADAGAERMVLPVHIAYPAALDFSRADPATLEAAALMTGGRVLADVGAALQVERRWWLLRQPAWPWLCAAAVLLLLVELGGRYAPGWWRGLFRRRKEAPA